MRFRDTEFTLLDTPGHVDFSTEMERTLSVLDYAILDVYKRQHIHRATRLSVTLTVTVSMKSY